MYIPGSGQNSGSKLHSPRCFQWKKSTTIRSNGTFLHLYSRDTSSSCSCPVAELALPEPKPVLRHHRDAAGYFCICLLNLRWSIARNNPVVQGLGRIRLEAHGVCSQRRPPNGWVVHRKPYPRDENANGTLAWELRCASSSIAFGIQIRLLVLAHFSTRSSDSKRMVRWKSPPRMGRRSLASTSSALHFGSSRSHRWRAYSSRSSYHFRCRS